MDGLDALWALFDKLEEANLGDDSEEGQELRASIHEFIKSNDMAVINLLKVININAQHTERRSALARILHFFGQHHGQELAVEQLGQHIAPGFNDAVLRKQRI